MVLAYAALAYLVVAVLFGGWFVVSGARRLDPNAAGASWLTRLLWLPAAALLWPVLILKLTARSAIEGADG